jgi:hypothetical protein
MMPWRSFLSAPGGAPASLHECAEKRGRALGNGQKRNGQGDWTGDGGFAESSGRPPPSASPSQTARGCIPGGGRSVSVTGLAD